MRSLLSSSLLTWLRSFDAAARHASFTLAAHELHVTQGAVSQQVKNLEQWLGSPLFHRLPRKLVLTPEGMQLKLAVKESFQILEATLNRLQSHGKTDAMNLNCSPSFAMRWLTPRISNLLREQPDLTLRVYGEFHLLDRIRMEQDSIEAAIRFDPGGYSDVRAVEFLDEWLVPVASPAFMAAHPEIQSPNDVPEALMLHDASPWQHAEECVEWNNWLQAMRLPVPAAHTGQRFNMSQLAVSAAVTGQGIAMGRLALVFEDLEAGTLVPLFAQAVLSQASYYYVSVPSKNPQLSVIETWLVREGQAFTQHRNAWCRKHRLALSHAPRARKGSAP